MPPGCAPHPGRRCGTGTVALDALADGLLAGGVTTVARASTGGSWLPLCELLEARGVQVRRIAPRHAKRAPGRPTTARLDGPWRQRLHTSGRLAGACRPKAQVGVLRRSWRHRQRLRTAAAHPLQPMHKAWPQLPLTRPQGVSDLAGVTGMARLKALVAGARDPPHRAQRRNPHCPHAADDIATALQGTWRAAHLCA